MTRLAGLFAAALFSLAATTAAAQSADLAVTISDGTATTTPGSNSTYAITILNGGPDAATNLTLSNSLPGSLSFVALAPSPGWVCVTPAVGASGVISCTATAMASGQTISFHVTTQLAPGTAPGSTISNTAFLSSATADPNPGNNFATDTNTVVAVPPAAVPTMTEWAMILFAALLAGGAGLHLERRRRAA